VLVREFMLYFLLLLYFLSLLFSDMSLLSSPSWPLTPHALASASQVNRITSVYHHTWLRVLMFQEVSLLFNDSCSVFYHVKDDHLRFNFEILDFQIITLPLLGVLLFNISFAFDWFFCFTVEGRQGGGREIMRDNECNSETK
jgi:hypothetical protein